MVTCCAPSAVSTDHYMVESALSIIITGYNGWFRGMTFVRTASTILPIPILTDVIYRMMPRKPQEATAAGARTISTTWCAANQLLNVGYRAHVMMQQQFLNGWCMNFDAYDSTPRLGYHFNLDVCPHE